MHKLYFLLDPLPMWDLGVTIVDATLIVMERLIVFHMVESEPRTENCAIQIICIHHKNTPIGTETYTQQMKDTANTLQIPKMFCQIASLTPLDTLVNHNTKWAKLTHPPPPPTIQTPTNPWSINPKKCLPLKYPPQFCCYTDGSFKPPKQTNNGQWR